MQILNASNNLLEVGASLFLAESEYKTVYLFYLIIWRKTSPLYKN